jgi:O-acetyl-ADP-ribose deacetylase (regulator of RNase III)
MMEFRTGNILDADAEALVNTVNCVGIMGRGIALQFKKAFPSNFKAYAAACGRQEVQPGRMFIFERGRLESPRYIINFPTKRHWKGASKLSDIEAGLVALRQEIKSRGIRSIAIPPLGSGLGGLNWPEVRAAIDSALSDLPDVEITVFEPSGAPDPATLRNKQVPTMTPGRAALIGLMDRYIAGLLDPFITLLEVHKLMYFKHEAGQQLRLRYVKASYGPYAENLRHVLSAVEGHFIIGFSGGGDKPGKQVSLVPGAVEDAKAFLEGHTDTRLRLDRVAALVDGFETPFGLELLSTVHWLIAHDTLSELDSVIRATYQWNERKKQFTERQIRLAVDRLQQVDWIYESAPTH